MAISSSNYNAFHEKIILPPSEKKFKTHVGLLVGLVSSTVEKSVILPILRKIQFTTFDLQAQIGLKLGITLVTTALLNRVHSASFGDSQEL